MPEKDALVCLRETTDQVRKGLKDTRKAALEWGPFDPAHDRAGYIPVMNKKDWRKLSSLAQSLKKEARKNLAVIDKTRKQLLSIMPLLDDLEKVAPGLPPPLPRIKGWQEKRQRLAAALRKKGLASDKVEALLKAEEKRDFRKAPQQLRAMLNPAIDRIEKTRQRHIASLMGAIHADAVSRFNAACKKPASFNPAETRAWCRSNYAMLLDGEKAVWQLLRDGKPDKAAAEAAKLGKKAEAALTRGAELAELLDEFAVCLASWNLAEEDGSPIPATADGVRTLGLDIMAPILAEWVTASQVHAFRKQAEVDEADRAEAEQERADADLMASLPVEALEGS